MNIQSRWLVKSHSKPDVNHRLLCLPYAGGSSSIYHHWPAQLPNLDVMAVQPPGRANRLGEANCQYMAEFINGLLPELTSWLDCRWSVFGHSMGALAGYALLQRLQDMGGMLPDYFFISASRGPQVENRITPISHLCDDHFINELKKLNGTPAEVLGNKELIQFCLPFIRADFHLVENYLVQEYEPLDVEPVLLCGKDDDITPEDMLVWNRLFRKSATVIMYPGDHFFLHSDANLNDITQLINQYVFG